MKGPDSERDSVMPWDVKSSFKTGLQISLSRSTIYMYCNITNHKNWFSRYNSEITSFWIEHRGRRCTLFWHKLYIGEICCQLVPSGNRNPIYFIGSFFSQPLISSSYVLVTQCPSKRLIEYKLVIEINMVLSFFELHTVDSKLFVCNTVSACLHCATAPSSLFITLNHE
jgi:hypothetical protein